MILAALAAAAAPPRELRRAGKANPAKEVCPVARSYFYTVTQAADLTLSVVKILCLALTQPAIDRNSQKLAIPHHPII